MNDRPDDHGRKQVAAAAAILLGIGAAACSALLGWRHLPGVLGEWVGTVIGVMTTPFLLEASFALLGLCIVAVLNHRRWLREGDEWVHLDPTRESTSSQDPEPSPAADAGQRCVADPRANKPG
jgi:hypothetical protein